MILLCERNKCVDKTRIIMKGKGKKDFREIFIFIFIDNRSLLITIAPQQYLHFCLLPLYVKKYLSRILIFIL